MGTRVFLEMLSKVGWVSGFAAFALIATSLLASSADAQMQPEAADEAFEGVGAEPPPSSPAILGGVGFAYGMTRREAARRCRSAGHRFERSWFRRRGGERRTRRGVYRCSGTPAQVGWNARTVLRFCRGRVCEVDVLMPLEERNRGVARWMVWFREIRAAMADRYGPANNATAARRHCLQSNGALGRCVLRYGAHVSAQWFPANGGIVTLHLVRIRSVGPHLRVTYSSSARTDRSDRPPPRPERHALAIPAGPVPF